MKNKFRFILALAILNIAMPVLAHEFWMLPSSFSVALNQPVQLSLNVGENFNGQLIGWSKSTISSVRVSGPGSSEELRERLPDTGALSALSAFKLNLKRAGTYMVALDSTPSRITLEAGKFHAYLHDEGLDVIVKQRESAGLAETPGRERYRRHVKTLLRVVDRAGAAAMRKTDALPTDTDNMRTAQRLQITPLADPFSLAAGSEIKFDIRFDGKPLGHALIKAWHKNDEQLVLIKAHSDADGKVRFTLPYAGAWMISVVHMIAATDTAEADWDSFWGNLTFELPV